MLIAQVAEHGALRARFLHASLILCEKAQVAEHDALGTGPEGASGGKLAAGLALVATTGHGEEPASSGGPIIRCRPGSGYERRDSCESVDVACPGQKGGIGVYTQTSSRSYWPSTGGTNTFSSIETPLT